MESTSSTHLNGNRATYRNLGALLVILLLMGFIYYQWDQVISQIIEWQQLFHSLLAKHMSAISQNPAAHGMALMALSFGYGVFHAIGPGHGKAVIATYLGSHKESLTNGITISLLAALLQAFIAIALVTVLTNLLQVKFSDISSYGSDITAASYVMVMMLGVFLAGSALLRLRSIKRAKTRIHQNNSHHHAHDNHTCCGSHHAHQPKPQQSWWQTLAVIVSMGIRPCAGAIVVLIYAHLVGALYYGMAATLVMGLGTGLSVAAIALGTQLARNWFENLYSQSTEITAASLSLTLLWLRTGGGVVIFLLGWSLYQAALPSAAGHPLM